jgi:hypothetical protein
MGSIDNDADALRKNDQISARTTAPPRENGERGSGSTGGGTSANDGRISGFPPNRQQGSSTSAEMLQ